MVNQKKLLKIAAFVYPALLLPFAISPVNAQDLERASIRSVAQNPRPSNSGGAKTVVRVVKVPVVKLQTKTVTKLVSTSDLSVTTEPKATVTLQPLSPRLKEITKFANEDGIVIFENLNPAIKYKVTASLDGYETQQQEELDIPPQQTSGINLELEPIKYELTIQTNISDGEVRYAPANLISSSQGKLVTKETGGYCIEPVKNGKAVIKDLKKGYYNIDIRPGVNDIKYQPVLAAVNVPTDILAKSDSNESQSYRIDLEAKISDKTFSSAWTNDDWVLPAGWRLENGIKNGGMVGLALPRNEQYLYYTNFEMMSGARLLDGGSIGFVVRALNPQNYYLIQISGENAAEPLVLKAFIVQNGRPKQISSIPINNVASTIRARNPFIVRIKGEGKIFKVLIENSQTAEVYPIGDISDQYDTFRKGAVGIDARDKANFEVNSFMVCPGACS
jgi:hypothetical protein